MKRFEFKVGRGHPNLHFMADPHLGHGNIIKYCNRPFLTEQDRQALAANGGKWDRGNWKGRGSSSYRISKEAVYEMNDTIIKNTNDAVDKDDILFLLGDVPFAHKGEYASKAYGHFSRINCKNIYLIWGNHDDEHDDEYDDALTKHVKTPSTCFWFV